MANEVEYLSESFDWKHLTTEEFYTFLQHAWNVNKAKDLLKGTKRELAELDPANWKGYIGSPPKPKEGGGYTMTMGMGIRWKEVQETPEKFDLSVPVIVGWVPYTNEDGKKDLSPMVIDGWHRMARGLLEGVKVKAVVLSKAENKKVKLR